MDLVPCTTTTYSYYCFTVASSYRSFNSRPWQVHTLVGNQALSEQSREYSVWYTVLDSSEVPGFSLVED